jgi:hypothetical protein
VLSQGTIRIRELNVLEVVDFALAVKGDRAGGVQMIVVSGHFHVLRETSAFTMNLRKQHNDLLRANTHNDGPTGKLPLRNSNVSAPAPLWWCQCAQ